MKNTLGFTHWVIAILISIMALGLVGAAWYYEANKEDTNTNTPVNNIDSVLTEAEARVIAEDSCIKGGETLAAGMYNESTQTWWYDANLNVTQEGCNPACVVSEQTQTAEINWRCTGLVEPE